MDGLRGVPQCEDGFSDRKGPGTSAETAGSSATCLSLLEPKPYPGTDRFDRGRARSCRSVGPGKLDCDAKKARCRIGIGANTGGADLLPSQPRMRARYQIRDSQ